MLKKAGIVVATAAAGVLAVSPLAFADGLINVSDIAVQVPIQACNNSVLEGVIGVLARDLKNDDSHHGKCRQRNSATDRSDSDHGFFHHRRHHHDD